MKKSLDYETIPLPVETLNLKEQYREQKTVLVDCSICIPRCTAKQWQGAKRFNGFYREMAEQRLRYARRIMARQARKRFQMCQEGGAVFVPSSLELAYTLCRNGRGYFSLYYDLRVHDGAAEDIVRYADTWSLVTGYPLLSFLPSKNKREFMKYCREDWQSRGHAYSRNLFPIVQTQLRNAYRAGQTYLTDKGIALFCQLSTLAPRSEGFPCFTRDMPD